MNPRAQPFWDLGQVCADLRDALQEAEALLRLEQAAHGLDARDEVALHALLAQHLAPRYAVAREVHYPSTSGRKRSHRPRCDLVLAPLGRPLRGDAAQPSLFDPPGATEPEEALWLEVKLALQFGEGGLPHRGYGAQFRAGVTGDLAKMAQDPRVRHAALALLVFTDSEEGLLRDLALMEEVLQARGLATGPREVRSLPVLERRGHRLLSVALWPVLSPSSPEAWPRTGA